MTQITDSDDRTRRDKPTLFCPACEHEGHISGAWMETTIDGTRMLTCPDCGATIDERRTVSPRPPAEAD